MTQTAAAVRWFKPYYCRDWHVVVQGEFIRHTACRDWRVPPDARTVARALDAPHNCRSCVARCSPQAASGEGELSPAAPREGTE